MEQPALFTTDDALDGNAGKAVRPSAPSAACLDLAARLRERWGGRLYLGTSSWYFPGWSGQVWAQVYPEARLSREGLPAYARHPLMRTVSLDRAFYRPLEAEVYRRLAAQVDEDFRFVVKAPALITDATLRDPATGAPERPNPSFLDVETALAGCVRPVVEGLGAKLGVLVFQLSPLPSAWLADPAALHARLDALWQAVVPELPAGALAALELRDPGLLTPELAALLRRHGVRYAMGLHDRMPVAEEQLPMLRASWPGDLVCRWNLQRGQRYAQARDRWAPFDRMQAPDLPTRDTLARVMRATLDAGHRVFVTINNKAEGSAPASVLALAQALLQDEPGR
jgi:uncharacterized protein YecE (DUF72 family)